VVYYTIKRLQFTVYGTEQIRVPEREGSTPVMNQDLTVGKPGTVLRKFCLPLFGSIIFQQLYNIADSFVAGKFIDNNALAAVGNGYEITLIFIAFAFGCNIGCSVIVSQLFGAKQHRDMKTAVHTTMIASGVLCAVLMLIGLLFTDGLLRLIQTPDEILADSKLYLEIYILGLPFVFFYNVATGIFSALGDSRTPFIFLACSSLSNIGMDILFVAGFGMKVDGVAWATFLCQGVSCLLAMFFVLRRLRRFETPEKAPLFSWQLFCKIAAVAVPSIMQQSFVSVGNIIIQSVINGFGTATIAGYSASVKLNNLVITSLTTLGNGISNFTAQNLGAGKYDRIRAGFRAGVRLVWCVCAPLVALYLLAGRQLVYIFMDSPTGEAMDVGVIFLRILSPFYFVVASKIVADGVLRGAGRMRGFLIATFTDLFLRVALAEVLSRTSFGSTGIWMAWPIGWSIATVISLIFYFNAHFDDRQVRRTANADEPADTV
jgi:putative MATE family efflux protein